MKLSDNFTMERMADFVRSNNVKYFVTRKNGTEMAQSLFGSENYVEVPNNTNLPTTIIIYEHVI